VLRIRSLYSGPHVFGPPGSGSGSSSMRYGSESFFLINQNNKYLQRRLTKTQRDRYFGEKNFCQSEPNHFCSAYWQIRHSILCVNWQLKWFPVVLFYLANRKFFQYLSSLLSWTSHVFLKYRSVHCSITIKKFGAPSSFFNYFFPKQVERPGIVGIERTTGKPVRQEYRKDRNDCCANIFPQRCFRHE
jgi:hypothetical protein